MRSHTHLRQAASTFRLGCGGRAAASPTRALPPLIRRACPSKPPPAPPRRPPARFPGESPTSTRASQFSTNAGYNLSSPNAQNPPASDIDYVYLAGREMVTPGVYTLLIAAKSGTPSVQLQVRRRPVGPRGRWPAWRRAAAKGWLRQPGAYAASQAHLTNLSQHNTHTHTHRRRRRARPAADHGQRADAHERRRAAGPQGGAVHLLPRLGRQGRGRRQDGKGGVVRPHRAGDDGHQPGQAL